MAKADWLKLLGATQHLPEGASITWQRPHPLDGAFASIGVTKRLEIRGVPFGVRKWHHLERMIRPVGTLRKIVCEGIQFGDPNCMCLDVEVDGDKEVPNIIWTDVEKGRDTKIMIAALPPPPRCHNATTLLSSNKRSACKLTPAARPARHGPAPHVSSHLLHPGWIIQRSRQRPRRLVPTTRPCCVTPGDVKTGDLGLHVGGAAGSRTKT